MSAQRAQQRIASASSARVAPELADLAMIFDEGTNVVAHPRALPEALRFDARRLLAASGPSVLKRVVASVDELPSLRSALPDTPLLAADVAFWVEVLMELTGASGAGVRLARVESALCPRFHVDRVVLRVVLAYVGSGTEYLLDEDVDRRWLGHAARGAPDAESGLIRPHGAVQRADEGAVVLLKGEAWAGNEGRGAVHRSPPASPDAPRLVLTIDPM
jgi:hypothetical protein